MKLHGWLFRVHYLVTRGVSRPQRAFSAIINNRPILDVLLLASLGLCWILAMEVVAGLRGIVRNGEGFEVLAPGMAAITARYLFAQVVALVWGLCASLTALLLGGKPRLGPTALSHCFAVSMAYTVLALPVAIIRLVDYGTLSNVSSTAVEVAPWIYLLVLLYIAQVKIHKTVPNRAVAYLLLGAMPLLLVWSGLRAAYPALLPAFVRW